MGRFPVADASISAVIPPRPAAFGETPALSSASVSAASRAAAEITSCSPGVRGESPQSRRMPNA
jgi:hypothetical protein